MQTQITYWNGSHFELVWLSNYCRISTRSMRSFISIENRFVVGYKIWGKSKRWKIINQYSLNVCQNSENMIEFVQQYVFDSITKRKKWNRVFDRQNNQNIVYVIIFATALFYYTIASIPHIIVFLFTFSSSAYLLFDD